MEQAGRSSSSLHLDLCEKTQRRRKACTHTFESGATRRCSTATQA